MLQNVLMGDMVKTVANPVVLAKETIVVIM